MTLEQMQSAVASLLTDPAYRARFFAADERDAAGLGLDAVEFRLLRSLDPRRLGIVSEGYQGKRLERVVGAFPRTLDAIRRLRPSAVGEDLLRWPHAPTAEDERESFRAWVATEAARAPMGRLLADLAGLDWALYSTPLPPFPRYRWRPDALRPRRRPDAVLLRARGPLGPWLSGPRDAMYPEDPAEWLVHREGAQFRLERLSVGASQLRAACDGASTVTQLSARFGPTTPTIIQTWLAASIIEDASS